MAARILVFLSLFFLLCTSREPPWADAHVVYDTTAALISRGELSIRTGGPPQFYALREGRKYGVFPLGNVLALVPSYLSYQALDATRLFPREPLYALTSHLSPAVMMAGMAALFYQLCRRRGASARWATLLTLGLATTTTCLSYARSTYAEAVQTLALVLLFSRTLAQDHEPGSPPRMTVLGLASVGAAAGVLFNTKLVHAPLILLCGLYICWIQLRRRPLPFPRFLLGVAVALLSFVPFAALALWHNRLKTGSIWLTGYQIEGGIFSGDLLTGLFGLLLSSGKGILWYAPPLLLGVLGLPTAWRRHRDQTALALLLILAMLLLSAKFRHWHADYCWGPRHLVPIMPLLLFLSLPWLPDALRRGSHALRRTGLALLFSAGLLVQVLGCSLYWDFYIRILIAVKDATACGGWFHAELGHGHFIPAFSPLRGHLWMLKHLVNHDPDMDRDAPWKVQVPQRVDLSAHYQALRLDWWYLDWRGGRGAQAGLWLLLLLGAGTAISGWSLARALRRSQG